MDDIKKELRVPMEEKERIFCIILTDFLNKGIFGEHLSKQDIIKQIQEKYGSIISPDEITATANISEQLISYCALRANYYEGKPKKKAFIDMVYMNQGIQEENVLKIVNAAVMDIVSFNKYQYGNKKYEFSINRLMDIVMGRDPYKNLKLEYEAMEARRKFKIVK